jgi:hypothetical protein
MFTAVFRRVTSSAEGFQVFQRVVVVDLPPSAAVFVVHHQVSGCTASNAPVLVTRERGLPKPAKCSSVPVFSSLQQVVVAVPEVPRPLLCADALPIHRALTVLLQVTPLAQTSSHELGCGQLALLTMRKVFASHVLFSLEKVFPV